jgi:arylsulfatase A
MKKLVSITILLLMTAVVATAADKPNFVFFLVDDFGWGALSSMGSKFHETPNIDKLASSGMRFSNGYAACTVCSPSRAAILTGVYPGRSHLTDWIAGHPGRDKKLKIPDWQMYMDHERILLPEALKENGYKTFFLGKWHLMPKGKTSKEHYPTSHGFDVNIGGREWGQPKGKGRYFHPFDMPNVTSKEGDFLTDRLTDYAVDLIAENKKDPFLLYFSYYTVHSPIMGKPELVEKYKAKAKTGKFKQKNAAYAAMVQSLDESVGRVIAELEKAGVADNTYIIFTGDNGADYHEYCGGLKKRKAFSYEGGIREPFFIAGPGIKADSTSDIPVIGTDFYPTILDLAGIPLKPEQHEDGVSLVPILKKGKGIKKRSLYWHYPHYHRTRPYGAVRNGDWKLIEFFEDGRLELYNLKDDIAERTNLAKKMPEKADELLKELKAWRKSVKAQMMSPIPNSENVKVEDNARKAKK